MELAPTYENGLDEHLLCALWRDHGDGLRHPSAFHLSGLNISVHFDKFGSTGTKFRTVGRRLLQMFFFEKEVTAWRFG